MTKESEVRGLLDGSDAFLEDYADVSILPMLIELHDTDAIISSA